MGDFSTRLQVELDRGLFQPDWFLWLDIKINRLP